MFLQTARDAAAAARPARRLKAIGVASSTGGPNALAQSLSRWAVRGGDQPIFVTQHMPAPFTCALAQQITQVTGRLAAEAEDGERVTAGRIYIAPGDRHMLVAAAPRGPVIRLDDGPPINYCRPAADPMLASLAQTYGTGALALVLTGMGRDGCAGAGAVKSAGGRVIVQDEATSVVWGMPGAVVDAGYADAVLPLYEIGAALARIAVGGFDR